MPQFVQDAFGLNIFGYVLGGEYPGVPLDWNAVRTNQELLKVPSYVSSLDWTPHDVLRISHEMVLERQC